MTAHLDSPLLLASTSQQDKSRPRTFLEPPNLTFDITKVANRCHEGGIFSDIYKCEYNSRSGSEEVRINILYWSVTYALFQVALKVFRFKLALKDVANLKLVEVTIFDPHYPCIG